MRILLVEDDELIAKGLSFCFNQNKIEYIHKLNIKEASDAISSDCFDLVLLDISLPDGNGFDFYKHKIKCLKIPTIFLTAKDSEDDIVNGLELGADDYITKPFSTKELIARINKAVLRQNKNLVIKVKDIEFDLDKMVVYRNKEKIELTSLEIRILYMLFIKLNKVVTRDEIINKIWELTGNDVSDNTVTVYLKRIRSKIKSDIIVTIKGIGYRIDEDVNQ